MERSCKDRLVAAGDFILMMDETKAIGNHTKLSIFVHYIASHTNEVNEEFLGLL